MKKPAIILSIFLSIFILLPSGVFAAVDKDHDGYTTAQGDCNDNNPNIHPGADDSNCDNIDNDCDGSIDEDYVSESCGLGVCLSGSTPSSCTAGVETICQPGLPTETPETTCADGQDNDCDGDVDVLDTDCLWTVETLDSAGGVGDDTSIGTDSSGKIHISYKDSTNNDLKYAVANPNIDVDDDGDGYTTAQGDCNDNNSNIHPGADDSNCDNIDNDCDGSIDEDYVSESCGLGVCLSGSTPSSCTAGVETICQPGLPTETPETTCADGQDNDCDGGVDVLDTDCVGDPSLWTVETLDGAGRSVGDYTSIGTDSSGKIHISYTDYTNSDLKYATNASGSWVMTTVDNIGSVGYYTSISIDSLGKAHISYLDGTNADLKYATNASGSWVMTTVDNIGEVGYYTSISIDSLGKAHISYLDGTNADLKYATNASGSWVMTTVDNIGSVGYSTSIAIDSSDKVHISYRDSTNRDLKYATNASGSWVMTAVDNIGDVGYSTSIAIDSLGKVHISYEDYSNRDLKYATNASGSWVMTTVDNIGNVGADTSIAIDSLGKVHISYLDYTNVDLKYATNTSGSWVMTTVDNIGNVGYDTSIAIDSSDKVHISYKDSTNSDLKYATNPNIDIDDDGYSTATDCNDNNPAVNPGAAEIINNGIDDDCNPATSDANIAPTADAGGPYAAVEGSPVTLDGSGSSDPNNNITTYEWDIENNGTYDYTSASSSQSHTYTQQGTYTIKLRVTDTLGATGETTTTATISDTLPSAGFTGNPVSGRAPLTVSFTNSSSGYDTPLTYEWDFDNNGTVDSTLPNPSYEYTGEGTYSVKLTVTDSDGSSNSLTRTNYISATSLPPVKIGGGTDSYFTSLQSAYDSAVNLNIILMHQGTFTENILFDINKTITLIGGYDSNFTSVIGTTVINGNVTISNGLVTLENILIQ